MIKGWTWSTVRTVEAKLFPHKPELHLPALVRFLPAVVSDAMMAVVLVITLVSIVSVIGCNKIR